MRFKRKEQTMLKSKLALGVLCASLVLLSGCSDRENSKSSLSKVRVYNNQVQTALPREQFPNDLIIEALENDNKEKAFCKCAEGLILLLTFLFFV